MSKVICDYSDIVAIADAVRNKNETTDKMTISEIVTGINNIEIAPEVEPDDIVKVAVENCSLTFTMSGISNHKVAVVYTTLNNSNEIETVEEDISTDEPVTFSVMKNTQVLFIGVSGQCPTGSDYNGDIVALRSMAYNIYYCYSYACTGNGEIEFIY